MRRSTPLVLFFLAVSCLSASGVAPLRRYNWLGFAITFYSEPDFKGTSVTVVRSDPDFASGRFGRQLGSARVRGKWLLCDFPGYQHPCVQVTSDVADLRSKVARIGSVFMQR